MMQKAQAIKEKINCTSSTFKTFTLQQTPPRKWKEKATDWEKISANHVSDKAVVHKVCKEFLQLNSNKKNDSMGKKMSKRFEDIFHQRSTWENAQSLGKWKLKPLHTIIMAIIKKTGRNKCWWEYGKKRNPHTWLVAM